MATVKKQRSNYPKQNKYLNLEKYHKATSDELIALKDKVRNLVPHWGSDGLHKEVVLQNMIKRFLPEKYSIGSGFVVRSSEERSKHLTSTQIDLIVYDNAYPLLFKEGDFVVMTPDSIRGIIEVKTNFENIDLSGAVAKANENGKFIFMGKESDNKSFFNGVFGYEGFEQTDLNPEIFKDKIIAGNAESEQDPEFSKYKVNHISINKDWFIKYWPDEHLKHSVYRLEDLSFSFFINNLVDVLASNSVRRNNFIWFATDKELHCELNF